MSPNIELERERFHSLQKLIDEVSAYDHGSEIEGKLQEIRELGRIVETQAMARLLRWFRDTILADARSREPGLEAWDRVDRDVVMLLRALENG